MDWTAFEQFLVLRGELMSFRREPLTALGSSRLLGPRRQDAWHDAHSSGWYSNRYVMFVATGLPSFIAGRKLSPRTKAQATGSSSAASELSTHASMTAPVSDTLTVNSTRPLVWALVDERP